MLLPLQFLPEFGQCGYYVLQLTAGFSLEEGEYAHLGDFQQTSGNTAAFVLYRCTFWVYFGLFFPLLSL